MKDTFVCLVAALCFYPVYSSPIQYQKPISPTTCKQTRVAILGAGMAGIAAGSALHNASIDDFLILDYNQEIGGRVYHTDFGKNPEDGSPYTIELGANWVHGTGSKNGSENPIFSFAKKFNLQHTDSNYGSIKTFDENGPVDYSYLLSLYEGNISHRIEKDAGDIWKGNTSDRSFRAGLNIAGWYANDAMRKAVEWWEFDWNFASNPEQSSHLFAVINHNTTFYQWSENNTFVFDPRGYSAFIKGIASMYMQQQDPRLLLNKHVVDIAYNNDSVTIHNSDNTCVQADYAITTFSLGVMQNATANSPDPKFVTFSPSLPDWKRIALHTMQMSTYTKIFLQFPPDKVFWDKNTEFFLYADPTTRGYYPLFQSLDAPGFLPGSGIIFCTVVQDQAAAVAAQSDEETQKEIMDVLRNMFGKKNVPKPTAFAVKHWAETEWARGSYSNWPPGMTLEMHQNIRANVDRVWFAGEHTHPKYFGYLQGAFFEGQRAGNDIAALLNKTVGASQDIHYDVLPAQTNLKESAERHGWDASSFFVERRA